MRSNEDKLSEVVSILSSMLYARELDRGTLEVRAENLVIEFLAREDNDTDRALMCARALAYRHPID